MRIKNKEVEKKIKSFRLDEREANNTILKLLLDIRDMLEKDEK